MALAILETEMRRLAGAAVRFSTAHASEGPLGARVQRQMRKYLIDYFERLEAALPWGELGTWNVLARARQGEERPSRMTVLRWRSDVETILRPVVQAHTPELREALFGPSLFARYAGALRLRVGHHPDEQPIAGWAAEWTDATVARFQAEGPIPPADATLLWIAEQSAPLGVVADEVREHGARMVTGMNATSQRRLANIIADGTARGQDITEIARGIKAEFPGMRRQRARLIALNETNEAMSKGAEDRAKQQGAKEKSWNTMGDDRVTAGCFENEGKGWVEMGEAFPSGHGRPPRFPGCRCAVLYRGGKIPPRPVPAEHQRITPELLDEALRRLVGELPEHTYKNGIYVPPIKVDVARTAIDGALKRAKAAGGVGVAMPARAVVEEIGKLEALAKRRPLTKDERARLRALRKQAGVQ